MVDLIVVPLADPVIVVNIGPVILVFGDKVNNPGDRVGSVGGAASVIQNIDAIDRTLWDAVDVGKREWAAIGGELEKRIHRHA